VRRCDVAYRFLQAHGRSHASIVCADHMRIIAAIVVTLCVSCSTAWMASRAPPPL
jgi:hypothetical protein